MIKRIIIKDIVTNTYLSYDYENNAMILIEDIDYAKKFDTKEGAECFLDRDLMDLPNGNYEIIEIYEKSRI
jgi:hypothetical protein